MKKDIQRAALALIIGTLAVMTGCDQSNNSNMKGHGTNGKNGKNGNMQDRTMKQGMDQGMNQSAKPMPEGGQSQMQDKSQQMQDKNQQMQDKRQQMHGGGSSSYQDGNSRKKSRGSQYHYYCD